MATLGSALLARDVSVEQAREQQWLNDYYNKISGASKWGGLLGLGGQLLGSALGGPLGGFLMGNLLKYGDMYRKGGFDKIGKHSGGKFYKQQMQDTLTDINKQQQLFNSSMLMDLGSNALGAFGAAGGVQAWKDEGWGTLMTRGSGPGAKSGWLGTTERAGGSGIGLGGWKGMRVDPTKYIDPSTGEVFDKSAQLTAGQVSMRNPYKMNPTKEIWSNEKGASINLPGLEPQEVPFEPGTTTPISGEAFQNWQKPAFWQYQLGMTPKTSPYALNPNYTAPQSGPYSPWIFGINNPGTQS
tara:strand:- start:20817 stop:21710 length:894 start_codon:yes stop_codon:yes gene_type:complete